MIEYNSKIIKEARDRRLLKSILSLLALSVTTYSLIDIPRRFMPQSFYLLLLIDLTILILYINYFRVFWSRPDRFYALRFMPVEFKVFFIGLLPLLLLSVINPIYQSFLLNILAIRTYILPIPMIFVGYHFFRSWSYPGVVARIERFLIFSGVIFATVAIIQFILKQQGYDFLLPMEHDHHSFFDSKIDLISSVFASSKKYSRFMLFVMILYWVSRALQNKSFGLIGIYFFVAIFISGSRDSMVLATLFLLLTLRYKSVKLKNKITFIPKISLGLRLLITVPPMIVTVYYIAPYSEHLQFFLAMDDQLDFLRRAAQFFPFFAINTDHSELLFGVGAARYGQEAQLIPELYERNESILNSLLSNNVIFFAENLTFVDSGLTKIAIEFGIIGILVWLLPLLFLVRVVVPALFGDRVRVTSFALAYMLLSWYIYFLKSHSILSDLFMSALFYLLLGGFIFYMKLKSGMNQRLINVSRQRYTITVESKSTAL
jgi:hypothetical protein